jgi:ribose transport system ATP-binding protein
VAPLLRVDSVSKSFGATQALSSVDLLLEPGEVHALIGENGAGKSTLMNVLYGALAPDHGSMQFRGAPYAPKDTIRARSLGVAMVHQEPFLCPDLTVRDNVLLGMEPKRLGLVDRRRAERTARAALELVASDDGETIALDRVASGLSPSERQRVALARALAPHNCRLLILDEPTSSLPLDDVERLFRVLARLRSNGLSVVYISHFLEEVRRIADRYTVLRDGHSVHSGAVSGTSDSELVRLMVGRDVEQMFQRSAHPPGEVVLSIENLAGGGGARRLRGASLQLSRGEVVGIAGLVGSGRSELLRAVFGLDPVARGQLRVKSVSGPRAPADRWSDGVGFTSEDRKREGLSERQSIAENLTLSHLSPYVRSGVLRPARLLDAAARLVREVGVRCQSATQPVGELSGGNQQKVALARLLHHQADLWLLDEPTRGIDVQSRAEVYAIVDRLAQSGAAILVVSSYLPELLGLCDRIHVMRKGVLGPSHDTKDTDQQRLLEEAIA